MYYVFYEKIISQVQRLLVPRNIEREIVIIRHVSKDFRSNDIPSFR